LGVKPSAKLQDLGFGHLIAAGVGDEICCHVFKVCQWHVGTLLARKTVVYPLVAAALHCRPSFNRNA
jgi:hypothetical protein